MKVKTQKEILKAKIIATQNQQVKDFEVLKTQYYRTIDSFRTLNLIKSSIKEIVSIPNLTKIIIQSIFEIGSKNMSKTLLKSKSNKGTSFSERIVQFILNL
jgi:hypothetical protein